MWMCGAFSELGLDTGDVGGPAVRLVNYGVAIGVMLKKESVPPCLLGEPKEDFFTKSLEWYTGRLLWTLSTKVKEQD